MYVSVHTFDQGRRALRDARNHLRSINGGYSLSVEDRKRLREYWGQYNKRPSVLWYKLLCAHDGVFDERYIPNTYWYRDILPHFNKVIFRKAYVDKNQMVTLFSKEVLPRYIVRCVSGRLYGFENNLITENKAIELILQEKSCIIKPAIDSGSGRGICFVDPGDSEQEVRAKVAAAGDNYIVQEILQQHEKMAEIHPQSLNTIRLLTFFHNGEVVLLSSVLRMGKGNSRVDNIGAGGYQCAIGPDGKLAKYASTADRNWVNSHPDGVVFDGFEIPSFMLAVDLVKSEHVKLGHFNIIGWDVAIDSQGCPKIIEFNLHPAQNQMTCGPTFNFLTDEVLHEVYSH